MPRPSRFYLVLLLLVILLQLTSCASLQETYRQADIDLEATCRLVKPAGEAIPHLTCRTPQGDLVDVPTTR